MAFDSIDFRPSEDRPGFLTVGVFTGEDCHETFDVNSRVAFDFKHALDDAIATMYGTRPDTLHYACQECGCTDCEVSAWVHANTDEICDGDGPTDRIWCPRCGENGIDDVRLVQAPCLDPYKPSDAMHVPWVLSYGNDGLPRIERDDERAAGTCHANASDDAALLTCIKQAAHGVINATAALIELNASRGKM